LYSSLLQWIELKSHPRFYPMLVFLFLAFILLVAIAAFFEEWLLMMSLLKLFGISLFVPAFLIGIKLLETRTMAKNEEKGEIICRFYSNYFTYHIQNQSSRNEVILQYPEINKIYFYRDTYLFYAKNQQWCFIPDEGLAEAERLALNELLQSRFPAKYKHLH
jgi:hypothetical protein